MLLGLALALHSMASCFSSFCPLTRTCNNSLPLSVQLLFSASSVGKRVSSVRPILQSGLECLTTRGYTAHETSCQCQLGY